MKFEYHSSFSVYEDLMAKKSYPWMVQGFSKSSKITSKDPRSHPVGVNTKGKVLGLD